MRRRFANNHKTLDYSKYMTIEVLEDGYVVYFNRDVEYNLNGHKWVRLKAGLLSPTLKKGDLLSLRCSLMPGEKFYNFNGNYKAINLRGNILSLIFKDDINLDISQYPYVFQGAFNSMYGNNIVSVEKNFLPATTLSQSCYAHMFYGCTSLTTAPELPATTLASGCYESMFQGCTSLTTAPELPATTLTNYCYQCMFDRCTSLTVAPELLATKLADSCYTYMFWGCSNLNYIKMLATDISANMCLYNWVKGVSSTGTFVKNPDMTSLPTATSSNYYAGIPSGWTVVDDTGSGNEEVLPESTEFGFPLYLNTAVTYDEGYYQERRRTGDKILEDFYQWFEDNKVVGGSTGDQEIPAELLEANPIYIDGNRVVSIYMSAFGHNIEFENNMYNDKSIYTLEFSFSATELSMYIYFDV